MTRSNVQLGGQELKLDADGDTSIQVSSDDVLVIGANALAQNGGSTIKDAGTNTASTITNAASIGTAAGSITVTA